MEEVMEEVVNGIITGKTIALDREVGFPAGSRVTVHIETAKEKPAHTGAPCYITEDGKAKAMVMDINRYNGLMDPIEEIESPHGQNRIGEDSDLEPGAPTMSRAEMEKLADELFGVWKGDTELALIFEKIDRERHIAVPRQVNLDAAP